MRIFMLEDDHWRRHCLMDWLRPDDEVTIIESCRQRDKFDPPYDLILLDHDLGGRQLEGHEDCGLTFVRDAMFELQEDNGRGMIIIHSYNPDGARNMANALAPRPNVHIAPFGGVQFRRLLTAAREASIIADPPAKERAKR